MLAFIIELSLGNRFALIFVVPTLYLRYLRGQTGGRIILKDTKTVILLLKSKIEITFFDVEATRKGYLSWRYIVSRKSIHSCDCDRERYMIHLFFDGQIGKIDMSGKCTATKTVQGEQLVLHIPKEMFDSICTALSVN